MRKLLGYLLLMLPVIVNAQGLKVTYIANEGVLLENNAQKVIIDALFDEVYKAYFSPSEATIGQMMASESPFNDVNLVLTTHIHGDHFEANLMGDFLKNHQESRLLSSAQIRNELEAKYVDFDQIEERIKGHTRGIKILKDEVNGVTVHSFFMYHSGGERTKSIENMGFIVEIGGKNILHLGDSDMNPDRFKEVNLAQYNIDVALVPYWYMSSDAGIEIINAYIKPKELIGIHYPKAPSRTALDEIKKNYPKAMVFQKPEQTINIKE